MFRQSPSRKRSNGFKVKHGLQIFLLVAICFWLLYQVKHSHDKKKAFDENSMKLSGNLDNGHDITKFGRKDLQPRVEEKTTSNEIRGKEEEIEGDEEENKPEEEEEEENKAEEEEEGNNPEEEEEEEKEKGKKPEEERKNENKPEQEDEKENKHEEEEEEDEEEKENKSGEEEKENTSNEEEQEKNKHADEEDNSEETKDQASEIQGKDDEIDEQDHETAEEEAERGEKFVDEEENGRKEENEEGENEVKEGQKENAGSSEDLDRDRNTQEAREENYKRDDASSAVFREGGNSGDLTEKELVGSTVKMKLQLDNTSNTERITSEQHNPDQNAVVGEKTENSSSVNVVIRDDKGNEVSQKNSPIANLDELQEVSSSSESGNMTTASSFLENETNITSELTSGQTIEMESANEGGSKLQIVNQTENSNITIGIENSDSSTAVLNTTENVDVAKREFSDTSNVADTVVVSDEQTGKSVSTAGEDNGSLSTETRENLSGAQSEKAETTDGNKEADDSKASLTTIENTEVVTNDPNNLLIPLEEKDARIDLGTLPETGTEGMNSGDKAVNDQ